MFPKTFRVGKTVEWLWKIVHGEKTGDAECPIHVPADCGILPISQFPSNNRKIVACRIEFFDVFNYRTRMCTLFSHSLSSTSWAGFPPWNQTKTWYFPACKFVNWWACWEKVLTAKFAGFWNARLKIAKRHKVMFRAFCHEGCWLQLTCTHRRSIRWAWAPSERRLATLLALFTIVSIVFLLQQVELSHL